MKTGTLTPLCAIYDDLPAAMAEVKVRENVWLSKLKILSLYKKYIFLFLCMCLYVNMLYVWCGLQRPEKDIGSPGAGVSRGLRTVWCGSWSSEALVPAGIFLLTC